MCFSAQIEQNLKTLERMFDARVDEAAFETLFAARLRNPSLKVCRALEASFEAPENAVQQRIHELILAHRRERMAALETALFEQKQRLATARRKLELKETRAAREHERIASKKIAALLKSRETLKSAQLQPADSRIFPFYHAPLIVCQQGEFLIRPMRYHCRPAGKPASYDRRYGGLYNARRDNLRGFWKAQFGHSHAIALIWGFYENVARHDFEQRDLAPGEKPRNLVLHFIPPAGQALQIACLYSQWRKAGEAALDSFAAVTDTPPPEIAATGHDRCVIGLTPDAARQWLKPENLCLDAAEALLDQRPQLVFEHQVAA